MIFAAHACLPQLGSSQDEVHHADVKLSIHEEPLVARVERLEAELKELRQLIRGQNGPSAETSAEGPSADQEGAAEPEACEKFELARSMFDAVVLIGSRSAEAPVELAVTIWALLLFVLNSIIQLLIIAVVVNNIATDQTISQDLIADLMCASGRALRFH